MPPPLIYSYHIHTPLFMYIPSLAPSRDPGTPPSLCYAIATVPGLAPSHPCSALPGPLSSMPITYVPNLTPRLWYVITNVPGLPLSYMLIVYIYPPVPDHYPHRPHPNPPIHSYLLSYTTCYPSYNHHIVKLSLSYYYQVTTIILSTYHPCYEYIIY